MFVHLQSAGIFTCQSGKVIDGVDTPTSEPLEVPNLILNSGLKRMGQNRDYLNYIHLGSGNTPPSPEQKALQNKLYSGNTISPTNGFSSGINVSDRTKPFVWLKRTFRISPRGKNTTYSELGIGWNDSELFSRTLIKDPLGKPTTITILDDEYLDVTYEFRVYIPTNTVTTSVTPTGDDVIPRTILSRACNASTNSLSTGWSARDSYSSPASVLDLYSSQMSYFKNGEIQDIFSTPLGSSLGSFNYSVAERINDTSARLRIARGLPDNVGTIRSLVLCSTMFSFQFQFDPPFNKTNEDKFDIDIVISWGRYENAS